MPDAMMASLKSKFVESGTYLVKNFKVLPNDLQYMLCTRHFKLLFNSRTIVSLKECPDIPMYKLNFKDFAEINSAKYDLGVLYGEPNQTLSDLFSFRFSIYINITVCIFFR